MILVNTDYISGKELTKRIAEDAEAMGADAVVNMERGNIDE